MFSNANSSMRYWADCWCCVLHVNLFHHWKLRINSTNTLLKVLCPLFFILLCAQLTVNLLCTFSCFMLCYTLLLLSHQSETTIPCEHFCVLWRLYGHCLQFIVYNDTMFCTGTSFVTIYKVYIPVGEVAFIQFLYSLLRFTITTHCLHISFV
jgi:hypothetical protein